MTEPESSAKQQQPKEVTTPQRLPRLQEPKDNHPKRKRIPKEEPARRRSPRLQEPKDNYPQRKRVPKGTHFQVDVIGSPDIEYVPPGRNNPDDSKYLGTQTWPPEDDTSEINPALIGKGRPDSCSCSSPGDEKCIKRHLEEETERLKSDLGPLFFEWKFNEMDEEVSKSWTPEEEDSFAEIEKLNPNDEEKNFMEAVIEHFQYKSSGSIVSYYFNVYLPRRIRKGNSQQQ